MPLSLFAGAGILGLLGFASVLAWTLTRGLAVNEENLIAAGFVGAALAYAVQATVSLDELSLRVALWSALGGLAAALVPAEKAWSGRKKKARPAARRPTRREPLRRIGPVVLVVLCVGAVWAWAASLVVADIRYSRAIGMFNQGNEKEAFVEFGRALSLRGEVQYRRIYGTFLGQAAVRNEEHGGDMMRQAQQQFAYLDSVPDPRALRDYARVLNEAREIDGRFGPTALAVYLRAVEQDPMNPLMRIEAARVALSIHDYSSVTGVLSPIRTVESGRRAHVLGMLALAYAELGEIQRSRDTLEEALDLDPAQPHALRAERLVGER